jgi:pyrroloquinoline quinone (PQQ) biosynthesis protein C
MQELIKLVDIIPTHKALNNKFYSQWVAGKLPIKTIAIFVRNYWEFSWSFPEALAELIINSQNVIARVEYTKILYSELGYGKVEKAHTALFEKFFSDLSEKIGNPNYLSIQHLKNNFPLLEATKKLTQGEKLLYSENLAIGAGAQLALECQAYNMISLLYEGARNYADLWPNISSFHESCEFFYVHIGSAEKDHKEEALAAINSVVKTDPALIQQAKYGFNEHLNLFADFWDTLSMEMETLIV